MDIRRMTHADIGPARALWQRTPGMGLRSLDDSPAGIGRFLLRNPSTCFAAFHGGELAGTILCGHDGRRGTIYHACVDPACRHRGLGRALVSRALDALRAEGIHKALLVCFAANTDGAAFWRALGWQERPDLTYFDITLCKENI